MGKIRPKTFNYAHKKRKEWAKKVRKNKFMPKECYMGSRYKKNKSKSGQK